LTGVRKTSAQNESLFVSSLKERGRVKGSIQGFSRAFG
jgi:hypothetical protein